MILGNLEQCLTNLFSNIFLFGRFYHSNFHHIQRAISLNCYLIAVYRSLRCCNLLVLWKLKDCCLFDLMLVLTRFCEYSLKESCGLWQANFDLLWTVLQDVATSFCFSNPPKINLDLESSASKFRKRKIDGSRHGFSTSNPYGSKSADNRRQFSRFQRDVCAEVKKLLLQIVQATKWKSSWT